MLHIHNTSLAKTLPQVLHAPKATDIGWLKQFTPPPFIKFKRIRHVPRHTKLGASAHTFPILRYRPQSRRWRRAILELYLSFPPADISQPHVDPP